MHHKTLQQQSFSDVGSATSSGSFSYFINNKSPLITCDSISCKCISTGNKLPVRTHCSTNFCYSQLKKHSKVKKWQTKIKQFNKNSQHFIEQEQKEWLYFLKYGKFAYHNNPHNLFLRYFDAKHPLFQTIKNIAHSRFCEKCGIVSVKLYVCNACRCVYYCSKKHQKKDWKIHKKDCNLYRTKQKEKVLYPPKKTLKKIASFGSSVICFVCYAFFYFVVVFFVRIRKMTIE